MSGGGTSSSAESSSGTSSETPVESSLIDGSSVTGESTDGESSDGESTGGESSDGESTGGESSDGESSDGESSDGESSDGESSDGESSDGESSDGESSDGESELTQDQFDALASGFAIDVSVGGAPCGSVALNDTGVTIYLTDGTYEQTLYYVAEEVVDEETGASETYVAEAWLNLANEVETYVSSDIWASYFTNIWSVLSVDDFSKLNTGVYRVSLEDLDNAEAVENYAIYQLLFPPMGIGLLGNTDVSDITVTTDGESITSIDVATGDGTIVNATVTAVGDAVEAGLKPYAGESIEAIDDMMTALEAMDYKMTREYALLDEETGEYVVDSDYTYSIYVDGGVYAYDNDGNGYIQQTTGVEYVVQYNGDWFFGEDFEDYTLAELCYLIDDWQISSVLFEETETEGTYALRDDVPVVADMGYYDAYMEGYDAEDLTITVGTDSIVFTAMLDSDMQYIVSYTDIGSTDISSVLGSDTTIYSSYNLGLILDELLDIVSPYGFDFSAVLGTDDKDLWYAALSYVYLPFYDASYAGLPASILPDPFTDISQITGNSYSISLIVDVNLYEYFEEEYLLNRGYSHDTVTIDGGTFYSVYTYTFEYTPTDDEGNAGTPETHTVSVYQTGYQWEDDDSFSSGYGYIYNIKIDLDLSAYTSAD